ncbi:MAG: tRNA lysidine(34) synthetase TilS [Bacteroidota bacterium]
MFSSRTFLTRFHEYGRRRKLIEERDTLIAAVSGGVDSVVMLDLLAREAEAYGLTLVVAHFNHQLRGAESDADEAHAARRARHYGFEFYVERANTAEYARQRKMGIQEAARELRYGFFEKLLESSGFRKVATAHNADDNAETVLLNLFRGAGVQGLAGIPVFRHDRNIIRPLLFAERGEIEEYARAEALPFRTDSSNASDHYTRNFLRHHLLPPIREQINPGIVQVLHRTAELFRELEAFLSCAARQHLDLATAKRTEEELLLSIARLRSSPVLLQQHVVMLAAAEFASTDVEYDKVNAILDLTEGLTGSWIPIAREYAVFRDREHLVFRKTEPVQEFRFTVVPNHRYEFNRFRFSSEVLERRQAAPGGDGGAEFVDADRLLKQELVLRTWSDGDAFVPLGMKTRKKISDFLVDARIPIYEKHRIPVLETAGGEIVWVCGHRIDDRFKITDQTRRVLRLEFARLPARKHEENHHG